MTDVLVGPQVALLGTQPDHILISGIRQGGARGDQPGDGAGDGPADQVLIRVSCPPISDRNREAWPGSDHILIRNLIRVLITPSSGPDIDQARGAYQDPICTHPWCLAPRCRGANMPPGSMSRWQICLRSAGAPPPGQQEVLVCQPRGRGTHAPNMIRSSSSMPSRPCLSVGRLPALSSLARADGSSPRQAWYLSIWLRSPCTTLCSGLA